MKRSLQSLSIGLLLVAAQSAHAQEPPVVNPDAPPSAPLSPVQGPSPLPETPPPPVPPDVPAAEQSVDPALLAPPAEAEAPQMSEEELKALGFGTTEEAAVDTDLKFFGFSDFTVSTVPMKKSAPWRQAAGRHANFALGNVNLFFSKSFSQNVRTMGEVRFHFAPHGAKAADGNYIENAVGDPADNDRAIHWGGIELERLYLEWQILPQLGLRTGMFLSPYGIWNVDHGSPLFIPVQRPYVVGAQLIPERQTGFEFLGSTTVTDTGTFGYHFTLSNGSGPVAEVRDLDDNKAVGGRLYWDERALGQLKIGVSAYYGKDTSARYSQGLSAAGKLTNTEKITAQSKVLSLAADIQFRYKGLHLQAEVITQQQKYLEGGRVAALNQLIGRQLAPIDSVDWGAYGLAGYRFDWLGTMPYFLVQGFDQASGQNGISTKMTGYGMGINMQPLAGIVTKVEYVIVNFPPDYIVSSDLLHFLQFQVAWAF
ncbi:MAG: hypothetical protein ABW252_09465 [Polyangiales bacterium]